MRTARGRFLWTLLALLAAGCGGRDSRSNSDDGDRSAKLRISRREAVASWTIPSGVPSVSDTLLRAKLAPEAPGDQGHLCYALVARGGDFLTATMSARDFDPYLIVADASGGNLRILEENDDQGPDPAARIEIELPEGTQFYLLAAGSGPAGEFELHVRLDPPAVLETGGDPSERYALLVGVGDYPGWEHDLPGVATDLGLVQDLLVNTFAVPERNILTLRDKHASRRGVMQAFLTQLGRAGPDGVAFFYYSGHGIRLETNTYALPPLDPEEDGRDEALFLGDGNILLDEEIGMLADRLPANRVLLVLDSCYSGTGSRAPGVWLKRVPESSERVRPDLWPDFAGDPVPEGPTAGGSESAPDPGRHILLSAAREDERAGVLAGLPDLAPSDTASVFTYHLTRLLREHHGSLSFQALTDSVRARTLETRALSDVADQLPGMLGRRPDEMVTDFLAKHPPR